MRLPRTGRHPGRADAALQYVPRSLALCGDSFEASVNVFLLDVSAARTQQSSCLTQSISTPMGNGFTKYFTSCLLKKSAIDGSAAKPVMNMNRSARDGRRSFAFRLNSSPRSFGIFRSQ